MTPARTAALACLALLSAALSAPATAASPEEEAMLVRQRTALAPLGIFAGTWAGPADIGRPDGSTLHLTQTERVGPALDGTLVLMEGKSYAADGSSPFHALAVVAVDAETGKASIDAHAQGRAIKTELEVLPDGYVWSIPAGPGTVRYEAHLVDGTWSEIGEFRMDGRPARKVFEMHVKKTGDIDWPSSPKAP